MAPPRPKSPSRIEVWRHEVSACSPSPPPLTIKPPSFWKKILGGGRKSKSLEISNTTVSGPGKEGKDGEESVKTEMYSSAGSREAEDKGAKGDGDGSSMDLEGGSDGGIGGALRGRAERLERARRLLESGGGKGGEGKGDGDGEK